VKKLIPVALIFGICCAFFACSGEKETATDETSDVAQSTHEAAPTFPHQMRQGAKPGYFPEPNSYAQLQSQVRDTLQTLKKEYRITRDEYWRNQGGVLGNEFFEVWYPAGRVTVTHGMHAFGLFMEAQEKFQNFFGDSPPDRLIIFTTAHIEDFRELTKRDFWFYSEVVGDSITMQPVWILSKRGLDGVAIPHEYYQWAVGKLTGYTAPRWLEEGVASYLAEEGELLESQILEFPDRAERIEVERLQEILNSEEDKADSRQAYYHSFMMVQTLVNRYGEEKLRDVVVNLTKGEGLTESFENAYGMDYEKIMSVAMSYSEGT